MKPSSTQRRIFLSAILSVLLGAAMPGAGEARELRLAQNRVSPAETRLISEQQAAAIARRATGGKVLSVELKRGKQPFYRVKVLLDSKRVKTIRVDARSGGIR